MLNSCMALHPTRYYLLLCVLNAFNTRVQSRAELIVKSHKSELFGLSQMSLNTSLSYDPHIHNSILFFASAHTS